MQYKPSSVLLLFAIACPFAAKSQDAEMARTTSLIVPAGAPLRLYLTKRISKRLGEPVEAKLLDPLYAFDRQVAPAGSVVLGRVVRLKPMTGMQRFVAIVGGDFTPLHQAEVQFTTLILPGGKRIALHTLETPGLNSLANFHPKKQAAQPNGVIGKAKAQLKDRIETARQTLSDTVRSPNKKELIEDYLWTRLPYHPQYVRRATRFDAELVDPLQFGSAHIPAAEMQQVGSQPPSDSAVAVRLITPVSSDKSRHGEPVEAIVSEPLFAPDHKLLLPEGTHLIGAVTMAHRARWFHRGGQLRFNFERIEMPEGVHRPDTTRAATSFKTLAMLQDAEPNGRAAMKVDEEGSVKATEPKTRLLAPVLAAFVASRASDQDVNKMTGAPYPNYGGRALGGISGFGLFGVAAVRMSPNVARALGFYGLAWSVFTNVVARGKEVDFQRNAAIDVRFGARTPAASKFRASGKSTGRDLSSPQQ